jgi:Flp pilus assembly protein TadD
VSDRPPRTSTSRIYQLDRVLARDPDDIAARFERAGLHREQGAYEAAKEDYLELLRRRPTDFGALNDFGSMVLTAGYKEAARSLFSEAVRHHPDNPTGRVNLGNLLAALDEFEEARAHFEAALRADPDHIHAHRGIGNVLAEIGETVGARVHRDKGFTKHFLTPLPFRGDWAPIRVLLLVSANGGNTPTASLLDDRLFQTTVLVAEYYYPKGPLPAHDVIFNAIGDADVCGEGLEAACDIIRRTSRPVINHPRAVMKTGRAANAERFRGLPNIVAPRIAMLPRDKLTGPAAASIVAAQGFRFPLLLRVPGFHTGRHFVRVENPDALATAAGALPGDKVWLIEQLDARDGAGMHRKFRVMIVDRKLYPLHLAISRQWKVHYYRADMAESAENRLQDGAFLEDMAGFIGRHGMAALARINAELDLDYGGIDFAVDAAGNVLLFEANATMVMAPLAADEKWAYRRPAFDAVFAAVRGMLRDRASLDSAASA